MHCYLCARGVKQEEGRFRGLGVLQAKRESLWQQFNTTRRWLGAGIVYDNTSQPLCLFLSVFVSPSFFCLHSSYLISIPDNILAANFKGRLEKAASQTESGQCLTQGKSNSCSHVTCKNIVETAVCVCVYKWHSSIDNDENTPKNYKKEKWMWSMCKRQPAYTLM